MLSEAKTPEEMQLYIPLSSDKTIASLERYAMRLDFISL